MACAAGRNAEGAETPGKRGLGAEPGWKSKSWKTIRRRSTDREGEGSAKRLQGKALVGRRLIAPQTQAVLEEFTGRANIPFFSTDERPPVRRDTTAKDNGCRPLQGGSRCIWEAEAEGPSRNRRFQAVIPLWAGGGRAQFSHSLQRSLIFRVMVSTSRLARPLPARMSEVRRSSASRSLP